MECRKCGSENLVRNGHNRCGTQQYKCKECGWKGILNPKAKYSPKEKERIIAAYQERMSMRGIQRVFKVARQTVSSWIKKSDSDTFKTNLDSSKNR